MFEPILIGEYIKRITGDDLVVLAQAIKKGVEDRGSVVSFSKATGVSQSTIFRLLKNSGSRPSKKTLKKLTKYIGRYIAPGTVIHCCGEGQYYRFRHKTLLVQTSEDGTIVVKSEVKK